MRRVLVVGLVRPAAALLVLALAASCAPGSEAATFPGSARSPETVSADASWYDFSAPRLNGGRVTGEDLRGRDVALWFWAPW